MGELNSTAASLRIFGDQLDPDEITQLLGKPPTYSHRKSDVKSSKSGHQLIRKTGLWSIRAPDQEPGNLDLQIDHLLSGLSEDLSVWKDLNARFQIDLFCGLFMKESNDGLIISANSLLRLGERGIEIDLDIYDPVDEASEASRP